MIGIGVAELVALCLLVAAGVLAAAWWRARAAMQSATAARDTAEQSVQGCTAILATVPLVGWRWHSGGAEDAPAVVAAGSTSPAFADFLAGIETSEAERVASAVTALRRSGSEFSETVSGRDGNSYELQGRRAANGDSLLWLSDVTAARRAEAEAAAAAVGVASARALIDVIPLPLWCRDSNLRLTDCNTAYAAALDMTREAVLADGRELANESGRERAVELARAALTHGAANERRHVVIAGSRRLLEVTEVPDRAGGTIGFALDRTELESVEGELLRHINAHGQVLESIHAAVAIYGADKRLSFYNSAFSRLWGLEEEWLAGEPSLDELLERLRERRRIPEYADFRIFKRQQLGLFTSLIEAQHELMHLPDERTLSVSVSPHPLGGLIFVYEDVTDRLALERSYNTLIEVQRETLDNLFEGIAVFGSDGRLKLYNPAYRRIWALSEADLRGEPHISDIVERTRAFYEGGEDSEAWPAIRHRAISLVTAQAHTGEQLDRRDGSVLQVATVPLPDGNMLITCLDVSDTARVERALRERNEALETAGRLKSEFIANVSYELRTPLNAIIGFAEILANQYFGPLSPRQLDYSRGILDSSHRLMSLINDILDLATIEAGYMALEPAPVNVAEMLDGVMTLTRERARNQDLKLTLRCPPDIGVIDVDERRLKQALFNLVSNAIKFTPAGGAIELEARRDGRHVLLSVKDTGVGIPESDHDRIFEKFERGNPQARESGAGLGLSLVKSLIELHGGTVSIDSAPGEGTTIVCRLPAQPVPDKAGAQLAHSRA